MSEQQNAWELVLGQLRTTKGTKLNIKGWLEPLRFVAFENGVLTLEAPGSEFFVNWLANHGYLEAIEEAARSILAGFTRLECNCTEQQEEIAAPPEMPRQTPTAAQAALPLAEPAPDVAFDHIVVGEPNRWAVSLAKMIAEQRPGKMRMPLFLLHGESGSGKTIILQAMRKAMHGSIVALTAHDFVTTFVDGSYDGGIRKFEQRLKAADVLMIDDFHLLFDGRKVKTIKFFHDVMDYLLRRGKTIVFVSNLDERELAGAIEQSLSGEGTQASCVVKSLISRLALAVCAKVSVPDAAMMREIVSKRANRLSEPSVSLILKAAGNDVRCLIGILSNLAAYRRVAPASTTTEQLVSIVLGLKLGAAMGKPTAATSPEEVVVTIQKAVAQEWGVTLEDLTGRPTAAKTRGGKRTRAIRGSETATDARRVAMMLCRHKCPDLSFQEIGAAFGGQHHTTVLLACKKAASMNGATRARVEQLCRKLNVPIPPFQSVIPT